MFKSGVSGNPGGRKKGSYGGRIMALAALDRVLARKENRKLLIEALEEDFRKNPAHFFKSVIVPLLPKESKLSFDHSGPIVWTSLLEFGPGVGEQVEGGGLMVEGAVGSWQQAIAEHTGVRLILAHGSCIFVAYERCEAYRHRRTGND